MSKNEEMTDQEFQQAYVTRPEKPRIPEKNWEENRKKWEEEQNKVCEICGCVKSWHMPDGQCPKKKLWKNK